MAGAGTATTWEDGDSSDMELPPSRQSQSVRDVEVGTNLTERQPEGARNILLELREIFSDLPRNYGEFVPNCSHAVIPRFDLTGKGQPTSVAPGRIA